MLIDQPKQNGSDTFYQKVHNRGLNFCHTGIAYLNASTVDAAKQSHRINFCLMNCLPQAPTNSYMEFFQHNKLLMMSYGHQFWPIRALLCGLNKLQPGSNAHLQVFGAQMPSYRLYATLWLQKRALLQSLCFYSLFT